MQRVNSGSATSQSVEYLLAAVTHVTRTWTVTHHDGGGSADSGLAGFKFVQRVRRVRRRLSSPPHCSLSVDALFRVTPKRTSLELFSCDTSPLSSATIVCGIFNHETRHSDSYGKSSKSGCTRHTTYASRLTRATTLISLNRCAFRSRRLICPCKR